MTDSVCLGIVTHNRASLLAKPIQSALGQSYAPLKVHVVNDGSTDETAGLVTQFPQVDWTNWPESRGYVAGRNFLMTGAAADYYASLDDDSWFCAGDEIQVAIEYLKRHEDVAAVAFDILSPDRPHPEQRREPQQVAMFIGCGHVLRLETVRDLGGYVSSPGEYGVEEKDLALRLLDAGYKIMLLPGVHVWHEKTTVARAEPIQHRSGVCNDLAMTLRRTPLVLLPIALAAKIYKHYVFARDQRLTGSFREGVALFFKSIPEIWKTRQSVRVATLRQYVRLSKQAVSQ